MEKLQEQVYAKLNTNVTTFTQASKSPLAYSKSGKPKMSIFIDLLIYLVYIVGPSPILARQQGIKLTF